MRFTLLYKYGTINFGDGAIIAKQNRLTGRITLLLSYSTTSQMFTKEK